MVNLIFADQQEMVREAVALQLSDNAELNLVAAIAELDELMRRCMGHKPDVVAVDEEMVDNGTISSLSEVGGQGAVVVIQRQMNPSKATLLLREGAMGVVSRDDGLEKLVEAIFSASQGRAYVPGELAVAIAKIEEETSELSEREWEIARLLCYGYSNREISAQLYLSTRTVESHRAHILKKTNCRARYELVAWAMEQKLFP